MIKQNDTVNDLERIAMFSNFYNAQKILQHFSPSRKRSSHKSGLVDRRRMADNQRPFRRLTHRAPTNQQSYYNPDNNEHLRQRNILCNVLNSKQIP